MVPESTIRLALLIAGLGAVLTAQEAPPPPGDRELVFGALEAEDVEARALLDTIRARPELTLERVLAILDAPPPRAGLAPGVHERWSYRVPESAEDATAALFVPAAAASGRKLPLWILSHGTGGDGPGTLRSMLPLLEGLEAIVAAPTEVAARQGQGWGGTAAERALHLALVDALAATLAVDRDRIVVMGFSRGGHAAWDLGARYPDRFAAVGPVIGGLPLRDRGLAPNLARLRLDAVNGGQDDPELVKGVVEVVERLKAMGADAALFLDPERGHAGFHDRMPALVERLASARRDVLPRKLSFAARELAAGRCCYLRITGLSGDAYRPGEPIRIPGVSRMDEAARRRAYLRHIEERTPRVEVAVRDNAFRLTTKLVTGVELYVPLALVDLSRPIDVVVNGRSNVRRRRIEPPSPATLLELMRAFGGADPAFRFAERIALPVR